ncbi:MAG: SHOCT domain-containing protein [Firmicutes bacterium]|nr:SHOCT domain-containing protein [Bacillota bacterium]
MMQFWSGVALNIWRLLPYLFWLLIIAGIFLLLRSYLTDAALKVGGPQSALEILRLRYAKGELSQEEYLRMKQDLGEEEKR